MGWVVQIYTKVSKTGHAAARMLVPPMRAARAAAAPNTASPCPPPAGCRPPSDAGRLAACGWCPPLLQQERDQRVLVQRRPLANFSSEGGNVVQTVILWQRHTG